MDAIIAFSSILSLSRQSGHPPSVFADSQIILIYICPALLHTVCHKAIYLDNQRPVVLYKCTDGEQKFAGHNDLNVSKNNSTCLRDDIDGQNVEFCNNRKH